MQVLAIKLSKFMSHDETIVEFPEKGIVTLTGPNGHGKSAIIEAIPGAVWNETLRGTPWQRKGEKSSVTAKVSLKGRELTISRGYTPSGQLKLKLDGTDAEFDSATKAQEFIDSALGSYEIWRRTHVFSSSDDAHLSRSTDAQRKRFMENILGLDKFDRALKTCKDDLRRTLDRTEKTNNDYRLLDTKQEYEKQRLEEAKRSRAAIRVPEKPVSAQASLDSVQTLKQAVRHWDNQKREAYKQVATCEANSQHAERETALLRKSSCPTCKRPIDQALRDSLTSNANSAFVALEAAKKAAEERSAEIDSMLEEAQADVDAAVQKQARTDEARRHYDQLKREKDRLDKVVEDATSANAGFLRQRAECRSELDTLESEMEILRACEKVLGIKGMRANITAHALEGLEEIANHWLERFTANDEIPMALSIKPFKELKRGGTSDEWSIDVDGAGGGYGYQATSAGQRQRIDVALLFSSLHIAQAALGMQGGTTSFDEVFDHLDAAGVAAVAEALSELSEDRLVIVITHSPELVKALKPVMNINVHMGKTEITRGYK